MKHETARSHGIDFFSNLEHSLPEDPEQCQSRTGKVISREHFYAKSYGTHRVITVFMTLCLLRVVFTFRTFTAFRGSSLGFYRDWSFILDAVEETQGEKPIKHLPGKFAVQIWGERAKGKVQEQMKAAWGQV